MYDLYINAVGGILGDDMGLGKTVQVIAFLNAIFGKNGTYEDWKLMRESRSAGRDYPVAIILCPGTLIDNWLNELETWSWTHVVKFHGAGKEGALHSIAQGRSEVLITTYTTYKNNADALNHIKWDVVIADECHLIKEPKSQITLVANQVNSKVRIGLTGTAIQNNYDELYTLLNWTNPGKYGTAGFWKTNVSAVLKNGQKHNATNWELTNARTRALELAKDLLPKVLLRRTKALIAHQLPKKTDKVVFCPLTRLQITAYENLMATEEMTYLRESKSSCYCGSELPQRICCRTPAAGGLSFSELLFPYLHYLRNLSNHMALCLPKQGDQKQKCARDQDLLIQALPDHWKTLVSRPPMQNGCDPELCGKWKVLQKLLRYWEDEDSKVLIFSSSVKLLDMLNDLMMQENYLYEYLHGGMTLEARSAAVQNFNTNSQQFIFLISTRAGGVGLNIVSANKVVIFDPNWNPAHDLQAQDRAYRIGQRRDVEVYRLISVGTVEEVVYARQVYKQQQANIGYEASEERRYFHGVQGDSAQTGELFGVENLLSFHGENHVLKAIFNETEAAEIHFENVRMANINICATQENIETMDASDEFGINAIVKAEFNDTNDDNGDQKSGIKGETGHENDDDATTSIASILASAGVSYSHQNNEIVGRSKIEVEITNVAAKAAQLGGHRDREAYLATILKTQQRNEAAKSVPKPAKVQGEKDSGNPRKRALPWI